MTRAAVLLFRGMILSAGLLVLTLTGLTAYRQGWLSWPRQVDAQRTQEARAQLHALVAQWVKEGNLAREDGWTYAVDVGHLLMASAYARDLDTYTRLRAFVFDHLLQRDPARPDTLHMVLWRYRPGSPPDASGTTEMLRVAQGLWAGAQAFDQPEDRAQAIAIVQAYGRHQAVEQGTWLIRNYYNFGTRAFATNSFTIDYAPDFLAEVAQATGAADIQTLAEKSYALVAGAQAECGLIYDFIQPEVVTIIPSQGPYFGPNDIVQISNTAAIVDHVARGRPTLARQVLMFARQQGADLNQYYLGRDGRKPLDRATGPETFAALLRVAVKLHDRRVIDELTPPVVNAARGFTQRPYAPRWFVASELWLALECLARSGASESTTRPTDSATD